MFDSFAVQKLLSLIRSFTTNQLQNVFQCLWGENIRSLHFVPYSVLNANLGASLTCRRFYFCLGEGLTGLFSLILHPSAVPLWSFVLKAPLPLLSSHCSLLSVAALLKAYLFLVVFVSTEIYHKLGFIEDPAAL